MSGGRRFVDRIPAVSYHSASCAGWVAEGTGAVGGTGRQTYTVHGDAINIAARLEALNKETGTRILITAETAAGLADRSGLQAMGELPIRGKSGAVEIFSLDR